VNLVAAVQFFSLSDCSDSASTQETAFTSYTSVTGAIKTPVNKWYHLAYVYSGTTMTIYVNGVLSARNTKMTDSNKMAKNHELNYFGRTTDVAQSGILAVANLLFDEIKLYKIALTQEQIVQDMNTVSGIPAGICDATTSLTTTTSTTMTSTTTTTTVNLSCLSNYWPAEDSSLEDVITHQFPNSTNGQFVQDRNNVSNGAILINSLNSTWTLPLGIYIHEQTTLTMWVNKVECQGVVKGFCDYGIVFFSIINLNQFQNFLIFYRSASRHIPGVKQRVPMFYPRGKTPESGFPHTLFTPGAKHVLPQG
jgi:hypothetical protein